MSAPLAYCNGRFIPQTEAQIALHDAGFVFGATVSDFCRTFHHRLFRLREHVERFQDNCRQLRIEGVPSCEDLTGIAEQLVSLNARHIRPEQELVLILLATPGPLEHYLGQARQQAADAATLILHTFPLPFARYAAWFREGARLIVPAVRHIPELCVDPRIKQRSRIHWWLAEQEVRQSDAGAQALLVNLHGYVTETATANLALVRDGAVLTPQRTTVLDGISLRVTEGLCRQLGITFMEAALSLEECRGAEEAFLTGTAFCLAGVRSVNGVALPWPGPITEALSEAWMRLVGLDFRAQILSVQ